MFLEDVAKLGEARIGGLGPLEAHPAGPGQNSLREIVRNWEADPEPRAAPGWDSFIIHYIYHFPIRTKIKSIIISKYKPQNPFEMKNLKSH